MGDERSASAAVQPQPRWEMDVVKKQSRERGPDITRPRASQADDVDGKFFFFLLF